MKEKIEKLFADWENSGTQDKIETGEIPAISKSRLLLINKDDAIETRFMIGSTTNAAIRPL